jgi:hypothetical protein
MLVLNPFYIDAFEKTYNRQNFIPIEPVEKVER